MEASTTPRTPACANCSRRKTKCDRNNPCSSCVSAKILCSYAPKRSEKKQRTSLSTLYETSLSDISNQLEELSTNLNYLVERVDALSINGGFKASSPPVPIVPGTEVCVPIRSVEHTFSVPSSHPRSETGVESSLPATSDKDVAEDAIGIVETLTADSKVRESLTQEDSLIQSTSSAFSQYVELAGLTLPPMGIVLRLLNFAKVARQKFFVEFPHMPLEAFAELCQKVYFPTQAFSIFSWLTVNCGLFYLFRDLDPRQQTFTEKEAADAIGTCTRNVDATVRSLKLCAGSTFEAVQSLLLAAFVVIEGERGSLSWTLVCTAARMSIDLGFHRLPATNQYSQERTLFWHIYALERSLAFNFGRSASIQDQDVKTTYPTAEEDFRSAWGFTFLEYINLTRLQYEIHEQLLSAKAQRDAPSTRVKKAHEYAARLIQIKEDLLRQRDIEDSTPTMIGIASMLTVVYRILPPTESFDTNHALHFHPLCVEAGRSALKSLLHVWQMVRQQRGEEPAQTSVKLPLLFIPYIPYIAVFGNQIATGDQEDLHLLQNIVGILQTVSEVTVATRKMSNGFLRLLRIAESWPRPTIQDTDMTEINWQDLGLSDLAWNQTMNDFDFGLGSDAIRDMMPWFEQQMGDFHAGG